MMMGPLDGQKNFGAESKAGLSLATTWICVVVLMQVADVKDVMMENIEKVLERGGKIEVLVDKADALNNQVKAQLMQDLYGIYMVP